MSRFLKDTAAALRDRHPGPSLAIVAGPDFRRAAASAVGALLALALGSALGDVRGRPVHLKVIALTAAGAFLFFGALTIKFVASELDRIVAARGGPAAASAVRLLVTVTVTGYVLLILAVLDVLAVPVQHLLLGGALTGVIVGIAAQQALGNAFAGLVLLIARPFTVGDQVRVRSGALGGEFTGAVTAMGLTYVSMATVDGLLHVPNAGMLAAAVGPQPAAAGEPEPQDGDLQAQPLADPDGVAPEAPPAGAHLRYPADVCLRCATVNR